MLNRLQFPLQTLNATLNYRSPLGRGLVAESRPYRINGNFLVSTPQAVYNLQK